MKGEGTFGERELGEEFFKTEAWMKQENHHDFPRCSHLNKGDEFSVEIIDLLFYEISFSSSVVMGSDETSVFKLLKMVLEVTK